MLDTMFFFLVNDLSVKYGRLMRLLHIRIEQILNFLEYLQ